ncbi:hypothetical protein ACF3NG_06785 [Aerococcaceae bacterium WGS1372]
MEYSPTTLYLKDLQERLAILDMPVVFKLPKDDFPEPFILIGGGTGTTIDYQFGGWVETQTTLIDIFLPPNSRTQAEEIRSKAVRALGRQVVSHQLLLDTSLGREVYDIKIRVTKLLT